MIADSLPAEPHPVTEEVPPERKHRWVGATEVSVPRSLAAKTVKRGKMIVPATIEVRVVEVYCMRCRVTLRDERQVEGPCRLGPQHNAGPRRREEDFG